MLINEKYWLRKMKYISEDGNFYKSRDFLLTMYPLKENEILTYYIRRV